MGDRRALTTDQEHLRGQGLEDRTEIGTAAQSLEQDPDFTVGKESIDPKLYRIDLGCGRSLREGFIGMDKYPVPEAKIIHDVLHYPWIGPTADPLPDNSCYDLNASHVVEHIVDLHSFMAEAYRVLIPGGRFYIAAPYWASTRAWQDPTHVRGITEETFRYFDYIQAKRMGTDHYGAIYDFEQIGLRLELFPDEERWAPETRSYRIKHYNNIVFNIHFTLRACKPMREWKPEQVIK